MKHVPVVALRKCVQLVEISLHGKKLKFKITYLNLDLDLTRNNITLLSKELTGSLDKVAHYQLQQEGRPDVTFSLSNNPLQCSCTEDVIDFIKWYLSTKVHINNDNQIICCIRHQIEVLTNECVSSTARKCSNITIIGKSVAVTAFLAMVVLVSLG